NTDKIASVNDATNQPTTCQYDQNGAVTAITKESTAGIEYYPYSGLPKRFTGDGYTTEILYDENNNRLKKTVFKDGQGEERKIYVHGAGGISEEITGQRSVKYLHGVSGIGAVSSNGIDYSVITDRLGYVRVVAECERIIQAYHYKPFGEAIKIVEESVLVNYLFGGYELDGETGLYNAKARLYSPELFRFLSTDPQAEFASPYLFCGNDPFALMDISGEASWIGALIGTVVGIAMTIGLTVLTMGAAAPVAVAAFGAGGTSIVTATGAAAATTATGIVAATSTAKIVGITAYSIGMTTTIAAASGLASQWIASEIDGEPMTAADAGSILFNSVITGLVFGGAATLISGVGKFVAEGSKVAGKYVAQGAILSLVNSGVRAAVSPVNDLISGNPVGSSAGAAAGFGAASAVLTTFSVPAANRIAPTPGLANDAISTTIWAALDPEQYYDIAAEAVDAGETTAVYESYAVGGKTYVNGQDKVQQERVNNEQLVQMYSCFGSGKEAGNLYSPRYFATRGFGQKLV
ncbi:MAG: RHS repeat-associated core domain-containing protein, partial [Lachnospiraceae bacterium]|nr:RHS repeat-associated core domain-containing protein [Lachnospiraceae bacterium]